MPEKDDAWKLRERVEKGHAALRVLEDPAFKTAVEETTHQLMKDWTDEEDRDKRDELWYRINALRDVATTLTVTAKQGQRAERDLELDEAEAKRKEAGIG